MNKKQRKILQVFIRWLKDYGLYSLWIHNIHHHPSSEYALDKWFKFLGNDIRSLVTKAPFLWTDKSEIHANGYHIKSRYGKGKEIKFWFSLSLEWCDYINEQNLFLT